MTFEAVFDAIAHQSTTCVSEKDRHQLYSTLLVTSCTVAEQLYADIVYLYMCVTSDIVPDASKLNRLSTNMRGNVLRSLVDLGTLIDKLEDTTHLDSRERHEKWKYEVAEYCLIAQTHRMNAMDQASWSDFRFKSRELNRIEYESVRSNMIVRDGLMQHWQQIIVTPIEELVTRPPLFFAQVTTSDLTVSQKRALVHVYMIIYSRLLHATRGQMHTLEVEIYIHEQSLLYANPHPIVKDKSNRRMVSARVHQWRQRLFLHVCNCIAYWKSAYGARRRGQRDATVKVSGINPIPTVEPIR